MTDNEQQWDQVLGDKLRRMRPDYRADSWDALADRLQAEEADLVTPADSAVAAAIENIQPRYAADSWAKLSAKLDVEESSFDDRVASAMNNIHPRYRPGSWAALAARLELEAYRRISIWQTKSLEFVLAFVLLLAFWVFFPYFSPPPAPVADTPTQPLFGIDALPTNPRAELGDNATRETIAVAEIDTESASLAPSVGTYSTGANEVPDRFPQSNGAISQSQAPRMFTPLDQRSLAFYPVDARRFGRSVEQPRFLNLTKMFAGAAAAAAQPADRETATPSAPLALAELEPLNRPAATPEFSRKRKKARPPLVQTWGVIGTHWDQNVVFTPSFTLKRPFAAETRLSRGLTAGATYGVGYGRHRWETGLLYRMKQYFPPYVVVTNDRERTLNRMRYHSVSIPLSYQPTVLRLDRWSAYLNVGVSFNATFRAHITIEDTYLNSLRDPATPRSEEARRAENFGEHRGLLQGGKFSNNAAVYTLLGAGVAYRLPSGLSFFLQPTVTRRIIDFGQDGEGPLLERINSNSILFGFKREF